MIGRIVECDECGKIDTFSSASKEVIKQIKRKNGWSFGKRDLCNECNKKLKGNKDAKTIYEVLS